MPTRLLIPVLLVAAFAASGCSGSDEDTLAPSAFTLRVNGGTAQTYSGSAFFSQGGSGGQPVFGIALGASAGTSGPSPYLTLVRVGEAPRAGRYSIADVVSGLDGGVPDLNGFFGFYIDPAQAFDPSQDPDAFERGELPAGFYYARSGAVTVDRVETGDAAEGSFVMEVQGVRFVGFDLEDPESGPGSVEPVGEPITVEGEFNASFQPGLFSDVPPAFEPLARRR